METNLIAQSKAANSDYILSAIDNNGDLAASTKAQYKRALQRAIDAGVSFTDAGQLQEYARHIGDSDRAFLKASLGRVYAEAGKAIRGNVTIENLADCQVALMRLEALGDAIPAPRASRGQHSATWLTAAQVKELFAACKIRNSGNPEFQLLAMRDRVALALMVGAGLRRDEARRAMFADVAESGSRAVLNVTGKGNVNRAIPLSPGLTQLLRDWRAVVGDGLIIRAVGRDKVAKDAGISGQSLYKLVQKRGALIGKPQLQPHDLRRTYARIGYNAGIDVGQVSLLLGHADIKTTQLYLGIAIDTEITISDFVPIG